jgi:hypothetical protein
VQLTLRSIWQHSEPSDRATTLPSMHGSDSEWRQAVSCTASGYCRSILIVRHSLSSVASVANGDTLCRVCYSHLFPLGHCKHCRKAIIGDREERRNGSHITGRPGDMWHALCFRCTGGFLRGTTATDCIPGCCRIVTGTDYILTPQGEPSCASCFEKIVPASIDPASSAAQSTAHIPKPEAYDKPVSTPNPRRHLGTASGKGLGGTSVSSFVSVRSRILALNSNLPG